MRGLLLLSLGLLQATGAYTEASDSGHGLTDRDDVSATPDSAASNVDRREAVPEPAKYYQYWYWKPRYKVVPKKHHPKRPHLKHYPRPWGYGGKMKPKYGDRPGKKRPHPPPRYKPKHKPKPQRPRTTKPPKNQKTSTTFSRPLTTTRMMDGLSSTRNEMMTTTSLPLQPVSTTSILTSLTSSLTTTTAAQPTTTTEQATTTTEQPTTTTEQPTTTTEQPTTTTEQLATTTTPVMTTSTTPVMTTPTTTVITTSTTTSAITTTSDEPTTTTEQVTTTTTTASTTFTLQAFNNPNVNDGRAGEVPFQGSPLRFINASPPGTRFTLDSMSRLVTQTGDIANVDGPGGTLFFDSEEEIAAQNFEVCTCAITGANNVLSCICAGSTGFRMGSFRTLAISGGMTTTPSVEIRAVFVPTTPDEEPATTTTEELMTTTTDELTTTTTEELTTTTTTGESTTTTTEEPTTTTTEELTTTTTAASTTFIMQAFNNDNINNGASGNAQNDQIFFGDGSSAQRFTLDSAGRLISNGNAAYVNFAGGPITFGSFTPGGGSQLCTCTLASDNVLTCTCGSASSDRFIMASDQFLAISGGGSSAPDVEIRAVFV